jgi:uncharacterized protein (DUF58 family)
MLSAEIRAKIDRLTLSTRRFLYGRDAGAFVTKRRGPGVEFDQLRDYQEGDDLRCIDWNSFVRTGKLFVRSHYQELSRTIVLLVDCSSSGNYTSGNQTAYERIIEVASVCALAGENMRDSVGLVLFSSIVENALPARQGQAQFIMQMLYSYLKDSVAGTSLESAISYVMSYYKNPVLVCIVSDFIDEGYEKPLQRCSVKHDVVAIRVQDPREHVILPLGTLLVKDPETGIEYMYEGKEVCREVQEDLMRWRHDQLLFFKKNNIDYIDIVPDSSFLKLLIQFFKKRV